MRQHIWWCIVRHRPVENVPLSLLFPVPGSRCWPGESGLLVMMRCCAPRRHQSLTSLATLPPSESHSTLLYRVSLSKAAWSELSKPSKTILRGNKILDGRCDVRRSLTWPRNCETESRERPETWDLVRDSEQWIAPPGEANIDTASGFYREIFHCDNFYWVFDW